MFMWLAKNVSDKFLLIQYILFGFEMKRKKGKRFIYFMKRKKHKKNFKMHPLGMELGSADSKSDTLTTVLKLILHINL